jgi:DNA modification methylase
MSKEDGDNFLDDINLIIKNNVNGAFYITFYRLGIDGYFNSLERVGLKYRSLIIWDKGNHTLSNSDYMSMYEPIFYGWVNEHKFYGGNNGMDIWDIKRTKKNDLHPTMKPIELIEKALDGGSKKDDLVLDIFLGSGSTLIAAEKKNRKCYGMELDPKYCDVIVKRWQEYTGKKAIHAETGEQFIEVSND